MTHTSICRFCSCNQKRGVVGELPLALSDCGSEVPLSSFLLCSQAVSAYRGLSAYSPRIACLTVRISDGLAGCKNNNSYFIGIVIFVMRVCGSFVIRYNISHEVRARSGMPGKFLRRFRRLLVTTDSRQCIIKSQRMM